MAKRGQTRLSQKVGIKTSLRLEKFRKVVLPSKIDTKLQKRDRNHKIGVTHPRTMPLKSHDRPWDRVTPKTLGNADNQE